MLLTARMGKGKPALRVVAASQLDLHVAIPFPRTQRETGQGLLVEFKRDTHGAILCVSTGASTGCWLEVGFLNGCLDPF